MLYTYKANGAKIRSSELWVRASGFWGPLTQRASDKKLM